MGTLHVAVAMEKMALEGEYQRPLPQMHDISSKIPALPEPLGTLFVGAIFCFFISPMTVSEKYSGASSCRMFLILYLHLKNHMLLKGGGIPVTIPVEYPFQHF